MINIFLFLMMETSSENNEKKMKKIAMNAALSYYGLSQTMDSFPKGTSVEFLLGGGASPADSASSMIEARTDGSTTGIGANMFPGAKNAEGRENPRGENNQVRPPESPGMASGLVSQNAEQNACLNTNQDTNPSTLDIVFTEMQRALPKLWEDNTGMLSKVPRLSNFDICAHANRILSALNMSPVPPNSEFVAQLMERIARKHSPVVLVKVSHLNDRKLLLVNTGFSL